MRLDLVCPLAAGRVMPSAAPTRSMTRLAESLLLVRLQSAQFLCYCLFLLSYALQATSTSSGYVLFCLLDLCPGARWSRVQHRGGSRLFDNLSAERRASLVVGTEWLKMSRCGNTWAFGGGSSLSMRV